MAEYSASFVLGTRPEIIKTAPVVLECARRGVQAEIIHTGQHYSERLDGVFFEQLGLPPSSCNLQVGSKPHGEQTGEMLTKVERRLLETDPDVVFVQGDTNSTLAGGLAASKLDTDVAHIEAGLRSFDREMPEETNRVLVDHLSEYLFAPTESAANELRRENIPDSQITVTGNTVVDAIERYGKIAVAESDVLDRLDLEPGRFCLLTAHRSENVDDRERFESLLDGVDRYARRINTEVIYPVHPRARKQLEMFDISVPERIRLVEPLDFFDFLCLENEARLVFTDSGGVQEETCILGTPCVTLRYNTERPETVHVGANCIAGVSPSEIVLAAEQMDGKRGNWDMPFGDGRASQRILDTLALEDAPTSEVEARGRREQLVSSEKRY